MLLSQSRIRPQTLKQKVYLFGEQPLSKNNSTLDLQLQESIRPESPIRDNNSRLGSALSPKMPHKKLKQEPKFVRSIQKRRSKMVSINKNHSLLDYRSYLQQNINIPCNPQIPFRPRDNSLKKSQTISYERSRSIMSPLPNRRSPMLVNHNLKMLIKSRKPSSRPLSKQHKQLLWSVHRI